MECSSVTTRIAEWPLTLDVPALVASGFRPVPFRQFVLKLTERCDLACDYCYVFAMADQGWRSKPARMQTAIVARTADRMAEHIRRHGLRTVEVILHGGEPLLVGPGGIDTVAATLRRRLPAGTELGLRVQTNGLRLDEEMLEVLAAHRIRVALSVDGGKATHDRHRRRPDGRGSHDAVTQAVDRLTSTHPELFSGLLCTIDVQSDPVETYEALARFSPPTIDLLLPHATWATPPAGIDPQDPGRPTPYGDWLVDVFDRWYPVARREPAIRLFDELIQLLLGGRSQVETIGLSPAAVVVIDTDGSIEQVDTLRAAYEGAASAGLTIDENDFEAAQLHPGIVARQLGVNALCPTCRSCSLHRVCGAGYYPHRYHPGSGFFNPSVYCADLARLIRHADARITADLARSQISSTSVGPAHRGAPRW
jgi:uncharacterized protein